MSSSSPSPPSSGPSQPKRHRSLGAEVDPSNILRTKRSRGSLPPPSPSAAPYSPAPDANAVAQLCITSGLTPREISTAYRNLTRKSDQSSSDLIYQSRWRHHQVGDPTYLCHRPQCAIPRVPVILLFEPLSHFASNLETIAINDDDLSMAQEFWDDLHSEEYANNHHKNTAVDMVQKLNTYVSSALFMPSHPLRDGSIIDGVAVTHASKALSVWLEYKSEPGKSGDPYFQVLNYALKSADERSNQNLQTYGVAINVLGPHFQVLAVTVVGNKVWADPLLIEQCYGSFEALEATARVWASVRQFCDDYKPVRKFTSEPVPWCLKDYPDLRRRDAATSLIYIYTNEQGKEELAKFVRSYCKEAHTAWMPYAPELRGTKAIAGKWMLVKMEYLSKDMGWLPASEILKDATDRIDLAKIQSCIVQMVDKGHDKGFVHGDVRLPNILLRKGGGNEADGFPRYEVRLLDFDWSGESDHAKYPSRLNKEVEWPPGATYAALISKEHDKWLSNRLLEQLEQQ